MFFNKVDETIILSTSHPYPLSDQFSISPFDLSANDIKAKIYQSLALSVLHHHFFGKRAVRFLENKYNAACVAFHRFFLLKTLLVTQNLLLRFLTLDFLFNQISELCFIFSCKH